MGNVVRPSVSTEWASAATTNNGANTTANKVEPTATHKSVGYNYPEQPARNHTNWWMNAVYQWIDYVDTWITKWGSINKNFAMDDANTTGLVFAYNAGKVSVSIFSQLSAVAGTLTLSDGDGTYKIYFDCEDSAVKKLVGTTPVSNDVIIPLYSVPVVGGAIDIANIVDLRSINIPRKASQAEVLTGTDKDKYVSPYSLQSFAVPSASDSVYGKVKLATAAEVLAQGANSVLTALSLSYSEIRASISKYGTVRLADTSDLAARTGDDVLTVSHLGDANARATTSLYGVTKLADNTDLLLVNRAANTDVLTAASLTQTNMQAAAGSAGIAALANQAQVDAGTDTVTIVTPKTFSEAIPTCKAWASFRYTGGILSVNKSYNVTSIIRIAAGRYTLNFTRAMPDADYCVVLGNTAAMGGTNGCIYSSTGWNGAPNNKTVSSLTVSFGNGTDYRDCYDMDVAVYG